MVERRNPPNAIHFTMENENAIASKLGGPPTPPASMAVKCCVRCLEASWRLERVDKFVWRGRKLSCVSRVCWPGCGVAPFWWLMHKRTAFPSRTYRQAKRRGLTLPRPEIMSLIWFVYEVGA